MIRSRDLLSLSGLGKTAVYYFYSTDYLSNSLAKNRPAMSRRQIRVSG